MKIEFNWGTGILITIIVMVLFMSTLAFVATRQDFYLVEDDYYEQGVNYQEKIEKRNNAKRLTKKIELKQSSDILEIMFPAEIKGNDLRGTLHFYSPVNKANDYRTEIKTDENLKQKIDISNLNKGRYTLKIDWKSEGISYYEEKSLIIR